MLPTFPHNDKNYTPFQFNHLTIDDGSEARSLFCFI